MIWIESIAALWYIEVAGRRMLNICIYIFIPTRGASRRFHPSKTTCPIEKVEWGPFLYPLAFLGSSLLYWTWSFRCKLQDRFVDSAVLDILWGHNILACLRVSELRSFHWRENLLSNLWFSLFPLVRLIIVSIYASSVLSSAHPPAPTPSPLVAIFFHLFEVICSLSSFVGL